MAVLRFDTSPLGRAQRLPGGGVAVPATIARSGIQVYRGPKGEEIREYRPPEEVFHADALASFTQAPVTIGHPKEGFVTPENWQQLAHGVISSVDGEQGTGLLSAQLTLQSADALRRVDAGELVELSCGYKCEVVDRAGATPEGERYDRVQTKIRGNHVALLPEGRARAGSSARLRLDGNEVIAMKLKFQGTEFDAASEADLQALQRRIDEAEKVRQDAADAAANAMKANDELKRRVGELEGKLDSAEGELKKAQKAVPEAVAAELKFREDMRALLPDEYEFGAKSRLDVKLDAIRNRRPEAKILSADKADEAVVDGYLLSIREQGEDYSERKKDEADNTVQSRWDAKHAGFNPNAEVK